MKKLFLVILAAGALTTSFAQSGDDRTAHNNRRDDDRNVSQRDNRDVYSSNNRGYEDRDALDRRNRAAQIESINRSYNARIYDVKNSRWLRAAEKRREIRALEAQRDAELRRVADRYNRNSDYDNRYSKNNSRY